MAAKLLGVKPDAALVVEDAEAGIQAAKAGGFCAAGIGPAANSLFGFFVERFSPLLKTLGKRTEFCSAIDKEYAAGSLPAA